MGVFLSWLIPGKTNLRTDRELSKFFNLLTGSYFQSSYQTDASDRIGRRAPPGGLQDKVSI